MRLTDFLKPNSTLFGFEAESREATVALFVQTLSSRGLIDATADAGGALLQTEDVHCTAIGNGVAIPHATVEGLDETLLLVAVAREPIAFGPEETEACSVFFVLLSPPGRGGEHIRLLARIARLASDSAAVDLLRSAGSDEQLMLALQAMDDRH